MGLFRRRAVAVEPVRWPERPPVEFSGVHPDEIGRASFPYEFRTDVGVRVRLHDMQFLGFEYRARSAELTVRFIYDDPAYTPPEARDTPVAVFRFEDVLVQRWEDLDDAGPDPNRVRDMGHHEHNQLITLSTGRTNLVVAARRMSVSMERLS